MNVKKVFAVVVACCIVDGILPSVNTVKDNTIITANAAESATEVEIPDEIDGLPVTIIGENAFKNCSINSIIIPDSVTSICGKAFYDCENLTSITISKNVTYIDKYTFYKYSSLKDINYTGNIVKLKIESYGNNPIINIINNSILMRLYYYLHHLMITFM